MQWKEDEPLGGEIIKLEIGESIEGILIAKFKSKKWENRYVYRIKPFNSNEIKILIGTTLLDQAMSDKIIGKPIKIKRIEDIDSGKEHPCHNFKTYTSEE